MESEHFELADPFEQHQTKTKASELTRGLTSTQVQEDIAKLLREIRIWTPFDSERASEKTSGIIKEIFLEGCKSTYQKAHRQTAKAHDFTPPTPYHGHVHQNEPASRESTGLTRTQRRRQRRKIKKEELEQKAGVGPVPQRYGQSQKNTSPTFARFVTASPVMVDRPKIASVSVEPQKCQEDSSGSWRKVKYQYGKAKYETHTVVPIDDPVYTHVHSEREVRNAPHWTSSSPLEEDIWL